MGFGWGGDEPFEVWGSISHHRASILAKVKNRQFISWINKASPVWPSNTRFGDFCVETKLKRSCDKLGYSNQSVPLRIEQPHSSEISTGSEGKERGQVFIYFSFLRTSYGPKELGPRNVLGTTWCVFLNLSECDLTHLYKKGQALGVRYGFEYWALQFPVWPQFSFA